MSFYNTAWWWRIREIFGRYSQSTERKNSESYEVSLSPKLVFRQTTQKPYWKNLESSKESGRNITALVVAFWTCKVNTLLHSTPNSCLSIFSYSCSQMGPSIEGSGIEGATCCWRWTVGVFFSFPSKIELWTEKILFEKVVSTLPSLWRTIMIIQGPRCDY